MRVLSTVVALLALLLVACGPSSDEIDQRIAQAVEEAVAASEARIQASFDTEWTDAAEYFGTQMGEHDDELEEQRHYIDTRVVEFRNLVDNTTVQFENYADNSVLALENDMVAALLANRQYTEGRVTEANNVIANARRDFQSLLNDATVATQDRLNSLVPSICETDFWVSSAWGVFLNLSDYLRLSPAELQAQIDQWWEWGLLIDESYQNFSQVCGVDASGRWYLKEQPALVPHEIDR